MTHSNSDNVMCNVNGTPGFPSNQEADSSGVHGARHGHYLDDSRLNELQGLPCRARGCEFCVSPNEK